MLKSHSDANMMAAGDIFINTRTPLSQYLAICSFKQQYEKNEITEKHAVIFTLIILFFF